MSTLRFGNPWHGTYSQAGLTLANGTLRAEWQPRSRPSNTHYVALGMPAAPEPWPNEAALGMVWKNDMVLHGDQKYWAPGGRPIGANAWLYRSADGSVFRMSVSPNLTTGVVDVYAKPFHSPTTSLVLKSNVTLSSGMNWWELNQSPRGDRCVFSVGKLKKATTSTGVAYDFCEYFDAFYELALTGGSATTLPSCTLTVLYNNQTLDDNPPDWFNPSNHQQYNPTTDVFEEWIKYPSGGVVMVGYNAAGVLQVISTRFTHHQKFTNVGAATPGVGTRTSTTDVTWTSEVRVNGSVVFSTVGSLHDVSETNTSVVGGSLVSVTTEIEHEEVDWDKYFNTTFYRRHLSNCLVAFAQNLFSLSANNTVVYARSFYGPADGGLVGMGLTISGPTPPTAVTRAAYNPRNGEVALGLSAGFI